MVYTKVWFEPRTSYILKYRSNTTFGHFSLTEFSN